MAPDPEHAAAFLSALDPHARTWGFQTFSDAANDRRRTRLLHGSLDQHATTLSKLNADGAGIFVAVNQTDGAGRKKANIMRINALFVDLDGAPLEPVRSSPTPPHIVVESSPERYHAYWRVTDCEPDACEPALKEMIRRFNGDPACSDRSRVLRLPGFWHRKREPFKVRTISTAPGEYQLSDLGIADFGRYDIDNLQRISVSQSSPSLGFAPEHLTRFLPAALGQRNRRLFDLARHLKGKYPDTRPQDHRPVVVEWHRQALPAIGTTSFSTSWGDFCRAWAAVHTPNDLMDSIMEKLAMASGEIPESFVDLGYGRQDWRLVKICQALQDRAGDAEFFLSARKAGELLGIHFTDAASMMAAFVADGVLELVEPGAGNKASRYRYVWPAESAPWH